jgi:uncharacterized protein
MSPLTLSGRRPALQWAALLAASLLLVSAFELMRLPAALLLGAIAAAILVSWLEGRLRIPPWAFVVAQGFVGCLVARTVTPDIVLTIFHKWPMFLTLIGAVIFFGAGLGFALAHWRVLPGTTAVWGSSPGAATAVVLMADAFGGDMRLVAVMQYLRVVCVGLVASVVARAWSASGGAASVAIDWFPPLAPGPLFATVALAWSAQSSASSRGSTSPGGADAVARHDEGRSTLDEAAMIDADRAVAHRDPDRSQSRPVDRALDRRD